MELTVSIFISYLIFGAATWAVVIKGYFKELTFLSFVHSLCLVMITWLVFAYYLLDGEME